MEALASMFRAARQVIVPSCIMYSIASLIGQPVMVAGSSMQPTFNPDASAATRDVVWMNRISRYRIKRGDVVAFTSPHDADKLVIKRVAAIPGDLVERPGYLEPVPPGHFWAAGENPDNSNDSRHYGSVSMSLIQGRVRLQLWPLSRLGAIPMVVPAHAKVLVPAEFVVPVIGVP